MKMTYNADSADLTNLRTSDGNNGVINKRR